MKSPFFYFAFILSIASTSLFAKVEINTFKNHSWNNEWNHAIGEALDRPENAPMLSHLDEEDLKELGCTGFNFSGVSDKKDFWTVFFSSLARAESAFNLKARSKATKGGHGNYGLLQLSKTTAREQCGLLDMDAIYNPHDHLRCGIKLMSWQLKGAPNPNGKLLRPDLKNQLFGKYILLWGPLRQNDKRGRDLLVKWFKVHLDQLSFCKA